MNKNRVILIIVIVCLFLISVFLYLKSPEEKQSVSTQSPNYGTVLNGNCMLYNQKGDSMLLSTLLSNRTLIYAFSRSSCPPCVKKDIEILNNISNHVGNKNIVVIMNYNDLRVYRVMSKLLEIRFKSFNTTQLLGNRLESKYENAPFFIVTDSIGNILHEIVSRPEFTESDDFFIDVLKEFN